MIFPILVALGTAAALPAHPSTVGSQPDETQSAAPVSPPDRSVIKSQLDEAQRAAAAGRLDQARLMISKAIAAGATQSEASRAIADFAFQSKKYPEALAAYQQLLMVTPTDPTFLERAGIAAFQTGE